MLDITKPQTCFTRKTDIIHKYSGKSNPTGDARVAPARVAAGDQSLAAAPPSHALPPRRRRSGLPEARAARGEGDGVAFPLPLVVRVRRSCPGPGARSSSAGAPRGVGGLGAHIWCRPDRI